jgi:Bacterial regulatory proteins, luxR family
MTDLETIGLDPDEEALYRALIDRPLCTLAELRESVPTRQHCQHAAILASLEERGLASRVNGGPGGAVRYSPVAPDVALGGLIVGCEENLKRAREARTQLLQRFRELHQSPDPTRLVEIIDDPADVQQRALQLRGQARQVVRVCNEPALAATPHPVEQELLGRDVAYHCMCQPSAMENKAAAGAFEALAELGANVRVSAQLPMAMLICDQRFALIPVLGQTPTTAMSALLVHSSTLLEALAALFDRVWSLARPARFGHDDPVHLIDEPSAMDRKLLSLLATGATDATIAKQLGLSDRTVHRRIHSLITRLGVSTRLQAGYEACRRGWL